MKTPPALAPVSATLNAIAHQYGLEAKLLEHRLRLNWGKLVGDSIAMHTRPEAIRFRKLSLIADSSVWLQQLTFLKPDLLKKINATAGDVFVSDLILRVGEVGGGEKEPHVQSNKITETCEDSGQDPDDDSLAEAAGYAQAVSDPELRAHLTAVMARALTSERDRRKSVSSAP